MYAVGDATSETCDRRRMGSRSTIGFSESVTVGGEAGFADSNLRYSLFLFCLLSSSFVGLGFRAIPALGSLASSFGALTGFGFFARLTGHAF